MAADDYAVHDSSVLAMQDDMPDNDSDADVSEEMLEPQGTVEVTAFNTSPSKRSQVVFKEDEVEDDPNIIKYDVEEPEVSSPEGHEGTKSKEDHPRDEPVQSEPQAQTETKIENKVQPEIKEEVAKNSTTPVNTEVISKAEESKPSTASSKFQLKGKKDKIQPQAEPIKEEAQEKKPQKEAEIPHKEDVAPIVTTSKILEQSPATVVTIEEPHEAQDDVDYGDEDQD